MGGNHGYGCVEDPSLETRRMQNDHRYPPPSPGSSYDPRANPHPGQGPVMPEDSLQEPRTASPPWWSRIGFVLSPLAGFPLCWFFLALFMGG